ncbi:Methionine adenosyltransferase [Methanosalsum zhilinae DSM 4017]|uniref:S-adenosylmethionine synthase n=2 Tax=Methanosalsum zhilinae TaxID=39669 RepID=F7XMV4_METZD|nr:Methionine adenosyltransferase [Methanosalsum zhilinae DSM 4017]
MRNIKVEQLMQTPVEDQKVEIVERKGVGHPDSIADGLAEAVSRALCREYIKKCGTVLHHNTDETQIVAGKSHPEYGGGEVIKPIYTLLVGRATTEFDGEEFAADAIAIEAARQYIRENFANINLERDMIIDCRFGTGSSDLRDVFSRNKMPVANDTSFGIGHAPFSELESIAYNTERMLNTDLKKKIPGIGEDIKVMGLREQDDISLTIGCATIGRYVDDLDHYINIKEEVEDYVAGLAAEHTERNVNIYVNTADQIEKESVFLTVTGTSAEMGDDGSVGRGNRCNGLITPGRPMSMEATSGKNPINHIGKIYNLLATQVAQDISKTIPEVDEAYVRLLSQIGKPIDQPFIASVQIIPEEGARLDSILSEAEGITDDWLASADRVIEMLINGKINTF